MRLIVLIAFMYIRIFFKISDQIDRTLSVLNVDAQGVMLSLRLIPRILEELIRSNSTNYEGS